MKKHIATSLALLCCISLCFAGCASPSAGPEAFALKKGVQLTQQMDRLAENEDYISLMSASDDIARIAQALGARDYSRPTGALFAPLTQQDVADFLKTYGDITLPEDILTLRLPQLLANIPNTWVSKQGVANLATNSLLCVRQWYTAPKGWSDHALLLLTYEGDTDALITFASNGEGVLEVTTTFVPVLEGMDNTPSALATYLETWAGVSPDAWTLYDAGEVEAMLR